MGIRKEEKRKLMQKKVRRKKRELRRKRFNHLVAAADGLIRLINVLGQDTIYRK